MDPKRIFRIKNEDDFKAAVISIFHYQYENNRVYRQFCDLMGVLSKDISSIEQIPYLPIEFFKSRRITCDTAREEIVFSSSGTTSGQTSKHFVRDVSLYKKSFRESFRRFYGKPEEYCILALLPSYLEREGSSLIYMVNDLIESSGNPDSGFYLHNLPDLAEKLNTLEARETPVLLIGVSYALLDLAESHPMKLRNTIVMETGGMKGRKKELIREDLHKRLCDGFGVESIHSEYGMTELLSQAYSKGSGIFQAPPWMKILIRSTEDPLSLQPTGRSGGINIIDLANFHSCSFIATQDLGRLQPDGGFEVLGRFDNADIRGCNLMVT